jgi:hypothetical protein
MDDDRDTERRRSGVSVACLFSFIAPLLGGCISTNTPGDLALTSVQAVDWRDQDEMPGPGASPVLGMVNSRTLALMGQSVTGGPKPHRPLLRIEFTSAMNLSKFATENSYNLGSGAYFCDHPIKGITLSFPDIFWRGRRLGQQEGDPIERQIQAVGAPITYYLFIDVAREPRPKDRPPQDGFDLRQKAADVCFEVRGGNESGRGYRSNTVVIPKGVIATALRKEYEGGS